MSERDLYGRSGLGIAAIMCERPGEVLASSSASVKLDLTRPRHQQRLWRATHRRTARRVDQVLEELGYTPELLLLHRNAYVNTGLNNALDREFGLGGNSVAYIGVDNNSTAVTAATVYLHGAAGATAANQIIKAISPAATRTNQTTTAGATFANADFTSGVFVINKLGFLTTATDAGTGLVDVIGGTAGSAPYNRTFVLDLTGAGTFSATLQIAVTAVAV